MSRILKKIVRQFRRKFKKSGLSPLLITQLLATVLSIFLMKIFFRFGHLITQIKELLLCFEIQVLEVVIQSWRHLDRDLFWEDNLELSRCEFNNCAK